MARETPSLDALQVKTVRERAALGVPQTRMAKDFNVSVRTIYAVIHRQGAYAAPRT